MGEQIGPGHIKGYYRSQVKEDPGDHPEGGFPYQVNRFVPCKKFPEVGQAGDDDDYTFQHHGNIIEISEAFLHSVLYEKNGKKTGQHDYYLFYQGGLYDLEKEIRKYK